MPLLPLQRKLRKRIHKTIALAQDLLVITLYENFPLAIVHGGTAVWRCYGSNRFSEDVDIYLPKRYKRASKLEKFLDSLRKRGFTVKKFKLTNDTAFVKFSYLDAIVSLEIVFKDLKKTVAKEFEMSDGSFIAVYTLTPEAMIEAKADAYRKRGKIRDLYDVWFLLNFVENKAGVKSSLRKLLEDFKMPVDERELKVLIISGAVPTVESMLEKVRRWAK